MRRTATLLPVLLALLLASAAPGFELGEAEREALARGELLVERREPASGAGFAFRALRVLEGPAERVWAVVRDCSRFHEFMPRMSRSERADDPALCRMVIDSAPLGQLRTTVRSREESVGSGWRRRWELVEGDYDHNQGAWTVLPWEPAGSLVVYEVDASPRLSLPRSLVGLAQRLQLPEMFDAVERRAAAAPAAPDRE